MALPPVASRLPVPAGPSPVGVARAEAVRAAQRAFFETALAGEMAAAPARPAPGAAPTAAPLREVHVALDPAAPPPERLLRPGSLLDVKV